MDWRRVGAGVAAAGTLGAGGTVAVDANINPYEVNAEKYELASQSTIEAAGENKVEAHRDRPAVTLSKWNGEAAMTVAYRAINAEGSRQFLTERIEWKGDTEEVHAYPLPAGEGMEDGGFEIEIVLDEAPDSNVFEFAIEGADELDFFYQPPLTDEEIADGAVRPENVIGSYAVYHKTKANHRVGDTNYATGKTYHIYRPKAFAADGAETWAELAYADGVLSVTVPQKWLEKAAYPVRVDPTFGDTTLGASTTNFPGAIVCAASYSPASNGTVDKLSIGLNGWDATEAVIGAIYTTAGNLQSPQTETRTTGGSATYHDFNYTGGPSVTTTTSYALCTWTGSTVGVLNDAAGGADLFQNTPYTGIYPSTVTFSASSRIRSIYATYTAAGGEGGATAAPEGVVVFE